MFDCYPISVVKMNQSHNISRGRWLDGNVAYIGRGSPLGNGYSTKDSAHPVRKVKTKKEAIAKFKFDLYNGKLLPDAYDALKELKKLHKEGSITLVCFCKPDDCHGDVIREYLEEE